MEILNWRYEPPYDIYNSKEVNEEVIEKFLANPITVVVDEFENIIGFYCTGQNARVPKGHDFNVYQEEILDIGLGMKPNLTGQGYGSKFFAFILSQMKEDTLRLTVAKFNKRAMRLYEKFGFKQVDEFDSGTGEFYTMTRTIKFRSASKNDLDSLAALYNQVALALLQKGIQQWSYPFDQEALAMKINFGRIYLLELNQEIVGAFSMSLQEGYPPLKTTETSYYLGEIAVSPVCQGQSLGEKIVDFAINKAKSEGVPLTLDCWAGNDKLKQFYMECGLNYLGDFPEEDYSISVFESRCDNI